jgi:hypothetical protein
MCRCTDIMFFQNPPYMASRQLLIPRIPCMARLQGYQRPARRGRGRCRQACERTPLRGRRRCAAGGRRLQQSMGRLDAPLHATPIGNGQPWSKNSRVIEHCLGESTSDTSHVQKRGQPIVRVLLGTRPTLASRDGRYYTPLHRMGRGTRHHQGNKSATIPLSSERVLQRPRR